MLYSSLTYHVANVVIFWKRTTCKLQGNILYILYTLNTHNTASHSFLMCKRHNLLKWIFNALFNGKTFTYFCIHTLDGIRLPHNHRQKIFGNNSLIVSDVDRFVDEGTYSCIARNAEGQTSRGTATVSVLVRPLIEPFNFPKTSLQQGQRYSILCNVIKGDGPVQIGWYKDNEDVTRLHDLRGVSVVQVNEFAMSLSFEALRSEHKGNYTVSEPHL